MEANVENGVDHIFKIICGAGKHSKDGHAILKPAVHRWLKDKKYDHHPNLEDGVFLVRL